MIKKQTSFIFIITIICFAFTAFADNAKTKNKLMGDFEKAQHDTTRIRLLNEEIAKLYLHTDPDSAFFFYNKAIDIADRALSRSPNVATAYKYVSLKAISIRYKGMVHYNMAEYDKAMDFYQRALLLARQSNDTLSLSETLNSIGIIYSEKGEYTKALEKHFESLNLAIKKDFKIGQARAYNNIGNVYCFQEIQDLAIDYYLMALKINEKLKNNPLIAGNLNNIGSILSDQGLYLEALLYYKRAMEIETKLGDRRLQAIGLNNIGNVFLKLEDYDNALKHFYEAAEINQDLGNSKLLAGNYNNLGKTYYSLENQDKALEYFFLARQLAEQTEDKNELSSIHNNLSRLFINKANKPENFHDKNKYLQIALNHGKWAMLMAEELDALNRKKETAETLISVYRQLGEHARALDAADVFISIQDLFFQQEKARTITEMQIRYESEQKQQKIERQQIVIDQASLDHTKQQLRLQTLIGASAMLLVLFIAILIAFRQNLKNSRIIKEKSSKLEKAYEEIFQQKAELQKQREELERLNQSLEQRVEKEINNSRKKDMLLAQQSRQATMGEMIANIAHQWKQPLNALGIIIQNLQETYEYDELTQEYIENRVDRSMSLIQYMSQTISDFRDFFKPEKIAKPFDVKTAVKKSISFVSDTLKKNGIEISEELEDGITVEGFPNEYSQVVINLINNAKDAVLQKKPDHPKIDIRLNKQNKKSCLSIIDNGGGIPDNIKNKILNPYFTTKDNNGGTGLGLYMSRLIVEKHPEGEIRFENTDDGAKFMIII